MNSFLGVGGSSWYGRPKPEDRINRKPDDQKNDERTKNTKNRKTEKMNSTVLNLTFSTIYKKMQ